MPPPAEALHAGAKLASSVSYRPAGASRAKLLLPQSTVEERRAMDRLELLKKTTFGAQIAEDEQKELVGYFVQTEDWVRIFEGKIDVVRGEKGSGKSAIYATLLKKTDELFDRSIIAIAAENLRGATVFKDLNVEPPTSEREFIVLWKLYIMTLVAQAARDYGIRNKHTDSVIRILQDVKLLEQEFSLQRTLRNVREAAKRLLNPDALEGGVELNEISGTPKSVIFRITLSEPTPDQEKRGMISIDGVFGELNKGLQLAGYQVWVLFDRLDVAFTENHALEANALRALMRTYLDLRGAENISLKVFLREDIWNGIIHTESGFREATHITKFVVLEWSPAALRNLLVRRLLSNQAILQEFKIDAEAVLQDAKKQTEIFDRFFPAQVEQGPQKATTFNWLLSRCRDGTQKTAPRELVHLLNSIRSQEVKRLERGEAAAPNDQLFDRASFKPALYDVSNARLTQYLYAEYPRQKPFIEKLDGQKAEQTPESLAELWSTNEGEARRHAKELTALGFFEERGSKESPTYWVPFLYRDALHLVQGKAEADD